MTSMFRTPRREDKDLPPVAEFVVWMTVGFMFTLAFSA